MSVSAVSIGVSACTHVPGGSVCVISMLDVCTTQRVNSRETESKRELMRVMATRGGGGEKSVMRGPIKRDAGERELVFNLHFILPRV